MTASAGDRGTGGLKSSNSRGTESTSKTSESTEGTSDSITNLPQGPESLHHACMTISNQCTSGMHTTSPEAS